MRRRRSSFGGCCYGVIASPRPEAGEHPDIAPHGDSSPDGLGAAQPTAQHSGDSVRRAAEDDIRIQRGAVREADPASHGQERYRLLSIDANLDDHVPSLRVNALETG